MQVKSHFEDVDRLIVKVKSAAVKNRTKQADSLIIIARLSLFLQDGELVKYYVVLCKLFT